jgi:hypothetical protein
MAAEEIQSRRGGCARRDGYAACKLMRKSLKRQSVCGKGKVALVPGRIGRVRLLVSPRNSCTHQTTGPETRPGLSPKEIDP